MAEQEEQEEDKNKCIRQQEQARGKKVDNNPPSSLIKNKRIFCNLRTLKKATQQRFLMHLRSDRSCSSLA